MDEQWVTGTSSTMTDGNSNQALYIGSCFLENYQPHYSSDVFFNNICSNYKIQKELDDDTVIDDVEYIGKNLIENGIDKTKEILLEFSTSLLFPESHRKLQRYYGSYMDRIFPYIDYEMMDEDIPTEEDIKRLRQQFITSNKISDNHDPNFYYDPHFSTTTSTTTSHKVGGDNSHANIYKKSKINKILKKHVSSRKSNMNSPSLQHKPKPKRRSASSSIKPKLNRRSASIKAKSIRKSSFRR